MQKTKKALLGTALAGAVVVGAGFGTFSWFTSSAEVTGEIQNAELDLTATDGELLNYINNEKLAPSRYAIGDWITITNDSTDFFNLLEINYDAVLEADNEAAKLDQYRSAAVLQFNPAGTNLVPFKGELKKHLENYLKTGQRPSGFGVITDAGRLRILDGAYTAEDLAQEMEDYPLETFLVFIPQTSLIEIGDGVTDAASSKLLSVITKREKIHFLYGSALDKEAGNEYQGATLGVGFEFKAHQLDTDPAELFNRNN
ncbi:hypothetical protein AB685_21510 [Bacillus sp. LL01]|uniref:hypothetical protein n=1 Tax=Bacillus sp. LL01 TaxID=1665556 RepID=UPI00064CF968|nr:hypothetical protein [Bacillus sp. LL01]KMJ56507.1 hypothetical protein AB685_21510 [Bacillus sp. LL01]